jgi:hypothetical protein
MGIASLPIGGEVDAELVRAGRDDDRVAGPRGFDLVERVAGLHRDERGARADRSERDGGERGRCDPSAHRAIVRAISARRRPDLPNAGASR